MKAYFSKIGNYLLNFEASLWIGILGALICMIIKAIASPSVFVSRLLQGSLMIIIAAISIFVLVKKLGYKSGELNLKHIIVAVVVIIILRQVLGYATGYVTYISGGCNDIARAIRFGDTELIPRDDAGFRQTMHCVMLCVDLFVNLPISVLAEYLGVKQRKLERLEMGVESNNK